MVYGLKYGIQVDELTGLHTRAYFEKEVWPKELSRAIRHEHPLSLVISDLDGLTDINNADGHLAGDRALRILAKLVSETIRSADGLFRWGGDEFLIVLPETDIVQARMLADRIRENLGKEEIGASLGVAEWQKGMFFKSVFQQADDELYKEKEKKHKEESLRLLDEQIRADN